MKAPFILLFLLMGFSLFSQQTVTINEDTMKVAIEPMPELFDVVEEEPEFPGGQKELHKFLIANLKYPEVAIDSNFQGKVYASFIVEADGSVTNITIKRGVHSSLNAEVIRLIGLMPKWKPGMVNGKGVRSRFILPINFFLN
jgi:protein TonB